MDDSFCMSRYLLQKRRCRYSTFLVTLIFASILLFVAVAEASESEQRNGIDCSGADGGPGEDGEDGGNCNSGSDSGANNVNCNGGDGGSGSNGGDGGDGGDGGNCNSNNDDDGNSIKCNGGAGGSATGDNSKAGVDGARGDCSDDDK